MENSIAEDEFYVEEYGLRGRQAVSDSGELVVEYTDGEGEYSASLEYIDTVPKEMRPDFVWLRAVEDYESRMEEQGQ